MESNQLILYINVTGTFYVFGAVGGLALLFIWLLVPETKGLSLEEIQASLIREPDRINQS